MSLAGYGLSKKLTKMFYLQLELSGLSQGPERRLWREIKCLDVHSLANLENLSGSMAK